MTRIVGMALVLFFGCNANSQNPEGMAGIGIEGAFPNLKFKRPVYITHAPDGSDRLFVLEQHGVIRVFPNDPKVQKAEVFLDISDKTSRKGNEEGLLGLAFHPKYKSNRRFYIHYSSNRQKEGIIAEYRVGRNPDRADPKSERILLTQKQPWRNHNGGMLEFGPDGYLYISFGDGGAAGDPRNAGQRLDTFLGTMLRIDVNRRTGGRPYGIPSDNPFIRKPKGALPEIWAYGLRNIWRFSFDRATGRLWGGDVGQYILEEIDIIERGGNYGWKTFEGTRRFSKSTQLAGEPAIPPVAEYGRRFGKSVTGGYVYRGRRLPSLQGSYLYADFESGLIWTLTPDGSGSWKNKLILRSRKSVASFGEDREGEVYFCSFDGRIYRFTEEPRLASRENPFPERLSETGLFDSVAENRPRNGVVPYDITVPFWSDGAQKERFVAVPDGKAIIFASDGSREFPDGTIFLKTFFMKDKNRTRRLETRLIRKDPGGWAAVAYVWKDDGSDAIRAPGGAQLTFQHGRKKAGWFVPNDIQCHSCHTPAAGFVLGFRPEQLGGKMDGFVSRGILQASQGKSQPWPATSDEDASLEQRARAWLDINCASCHQPDGPGNAAIDLRAATPLNKTGMIDVVPAQGDLGIRGARIIAPGKPSKSTLWLRVCKREPGFMPPLATEVVDTAGSSLLKEWIRSIPR